MNPISTALVTGVLIILGKWADNKAPNIDNAIGVAGIAVSLAIIETASKPLARAFAMLIVLSVVIVYFPRIATAAGLGKKK